MNDIGKSCSIVIPCECECIVFYNGHCLKHDKKFHVEFNVKTISKLEERIKALEERLSKIEELAKDD